MGGRIAAIAVDPEDPAVFYLGHATGGLWKTTNGGTTFSPMMEKERVFSIGDVAVAPSDPRVIWVGTGEATDCNSAGFGSGVYRSTDGGATWNHVGLPASRAIGRLEERAGERIADALASDGGVDVAVHHLDSPDRATALAERLQTRVGDAGQVRVLELGAVVGAHVGPGTLATVVSPR